MVPNTMPQLIGFYEGSMSIYIFELENILKMEDKEKQEIRLNVMLNSMKSTLNQGKAYWEEVVKAR